MKFLILKIFIVFFAAITISGCFDIRREIKFYPNGGGIEKLYITLEKSFFDTFQTFASYDQTGKQKRKLDSLMNNELLQRGILTDVLRTGGTSVKDVLVTDKSDGSKVIYIEYTFDDPASLTKIVKEATYSFSNQLNINFSTLKFYDEPDKIRFKYIVRNASRSFDDSLALSTFSSIIASKQITTSIEFPFEVTGSNSNSQNGNIITWEFPLYDAMFNQIEMNAEMKKQEGLDLPYAEKVEKQLEKIDKNKSPLIRVQVYNANKEPVKIGTGIIVKDDELVTNFNLMNLIEGQGYFSVILNNDSLAGVDEMQESDLDQKGDLVILRFSNHEKVKPLKYASMEVKYGDKVRIFYYPNTLSSVVYSMEGTITGQKKWNKISLVEVKPAKPISLDGGAVFNDNGEFVGLITTAYPGEVGKMYLIPALYIKTKVK
jgi:hypothetical protein